MLDQIKIDTSGDYVEDRHAVSVRRKRAEPAGDHVGALKPLSTGGTSIFGRPRPTIGTINTTFSPGPGMQVFAGVRSEPFFIDLNQFYATFPDRMTPLTGKQVNYASIHAADTPQTTGFRPPGQAMDYLIDLNVLSIVVELPKSMIGDGTIRVWETTSVGTASPAYTYAQQDRLARPVVNELPSPR